MLESLSGLEGMLGSSNIYIEENDSLRSLAGLDGLVRVGQIMKVQNNPVLESVGALSSLEMVGNHAIIKGNPMIPTCEVEAIASSVGSQLFWFDTNDAALCD